MKPYILKTALFSGILLFGLGKAHSQSNLLSWATSFSPAWAAGNTSGTATNIGGTGVNCTVTIAITGGGAFSAPYPRVNANNSNPADFQVQSSVDALEIDQDLATRSAFSLITYTFSKPVQNVQFGIADIDYPGPGTPYNYIDQVTISATGPNGPVTPTITKYNSASTVFNIVSNICTAVAGAGGANVSSLTQGIPNQNGTAFVDFGTGAITSITIQYGTQNVATVRNNPRLQAISLGNLTFIPVSSLPIGLTDFNGQLKNNTVQLQWKTASGADQGWIYVERSAPGKPWETVPGMAPQALAGLTKYSATDHTPVSGVSFYRLRQVTANGEVLYSKIIRMDASPSKEISIRAYPNPFQSQFNMEINWPQQEKISITAFSMTGIQVFESSVTVQEGFQVLSLSQFAVLPSGTYTIRVQGSGIRKSLKVTKE